MMEAKIEQIKFYILTELRNSFLASEIHEKLETAYAKENQIHLRQFPRKAKEFREGRSSSVKKK